MKKALWVALFLVLVLTVSCSSKKKEVPAEPEEQVFMTEVSKPTTILETVKVERDMSGGVGDYETCTAYEDYLDKALENKQNNNFMDIVNKETDVVVFITAEYLDKIAENDSGWGVYTKVSHKDSFYIYEVYAGKMKSIPDGADPENADEWFEAYAKFNVNEEGKVYLTTAGQEPQLFGQIKPRAMNIKAAE